MGGSLTIVTVGGIPIRIHWTFLILLAWVVIGGAMRSGSAAGALSAGLFVLALFTCVVLHELGHAMAARFYGVKTRDITLLPIGGVASLERIPENPIQELVIAVAGPLVNVIIALILLPSFAWADARGLLVTVGEPGVHAAEFFASLAAVNIWLVIFNMIPAFPMDGGRVARAILAMIVGRARATRIAARLGQGVAAVMALAGLFINPMLLLIAMFVWLGATAENRDVQTRTMLRGLPAAAATIRRFRVLRADDPLAKAGDELLAGSQTDFPVTDTGDASGQIVGVLTRADLVQALTRHGLNARVGDFVRRDCSIVDAGAPLESAIDLLQTSGCPMVLVRGPGGLAGFITMENVAELLWLRQSDDAFRQAGAPSAPPPGTATSAAAAGAPTPPPGV